MFSTMSPPLAAWNAPAMAEFLWTPVWTWPVIATVVLELVFVGVCGGILWHFGRPRRVLARPRKRRTRGVPHAAPLREVPSRPRAA